MDAAFKKNMLVLEQYLNGARYFEALSALNFAKRFHVGRRKDGITPEFDHQVSIALYALTLPEVIDREGLIATIILHDVSEDYDVPAAELRAIFRDDEFAARVTRSVDCMTKTYRGVKKDPETLYAEMANDPRASLAKPCDRIHNLQSMVGVFTLDKQRDYIDEARRYIFPMAKVARRNFPQQRLAYENVKWVMRSQIELIEAMHAAATQVSPAAPDGARASSPPAV